MKKKTLFAVIMAITFLPILVSSALSWTRTYGPYLYRYYYARLYQSYCQKCYDDRFSSAEQAVTKSQRAADASNRAVNRAESTFARYRFPQRLAQNYPIANIFAQKLLQGERIYAKALNQYNAFMNRHIEDLRIWGRLYDQLFNPVHQALQEKANYTRGYAKTMAIALMKQGALQTNEREHLSLSLPSHITVRHRKPPLAPFRGGFQGKATIYASQAMKELMADFYNCVVVEGGIYGYWQSDTFVPSDPGNTICQQGQCNCETIL